ncbi:transglutaminase family protein [Heliorestis convoluta]|uniref:Transglutaminase family protein n=1 Tax=Heliorestis convoluta TaxID=356322 RepID=A0A5Q2N1R0_9FIRM|nr:transglutaminase family protein [Heliorestis convoluta]
MTPMTDQNQRLLSFQLKTEPLGALQQSMDAFGNQVHTLWFPEPHDQLVIETRAIVENQQVENSIVQHNNILRNSDATLEYVDIEQWSKQIKQSHAEWLMETSYCPFLPEVQMMAESFQGISGGWPEIYKMSNYIYENFTYQEQVTAVGSTIDAILSKKVGVCQDFSHLLLALLRFQGIPARYVSGYIPCGGPLRGSGASHAWVEAYLPGIGWQGIDPTNNCTVNDAYVKVAHGRDYLDIVPVKGLYCGRARQNLQVTVYVQVL